MENKAVLRLLLELINSKSLDEDTFKYGMMQCMEYTPDDILKYEYDEELETHYIYSAIANVSIQYNWFQCKELIARLKVLIEYLIHDSQTCNLAIFFLQNHPDRIKECKGTLRLTANSTILIREYAYDIESKMVIEPAYVLTTYLDYPFNLAQDALNGNVNAVSIFAMTDASKRLPTTAYGAQSSTYALHRNVPTCACLLWFPVELLKLLQIPEMLTKGILSLSNGRYTETIDIYHTNNERERYAVTQNDYLGCCPIPFVPITEFYILSSALDMLRLIRFFYARNELAGKCFISIGSNDRIDAAFSAVRDIQSRNPDATIYAWLRNKGSNPAIAHIHKYYPDVIQLGKNVEQPGGLLYEENILLKIVPEKYRTMPSVK